MEQRQIPKAVAYARVSTLLKQDPEHQLVPIRGVVANRGFQLADEYVDRISGSAEKRKELDRLIRDARMGKFKVVVIYALDRLARDTRFLLNLLHELDGYGVTIISLRESIDLGSPVGKAVLQILGSMAELERNLISERIKTALAVKKLTATETGWRCGRKPLSKEIVEQVKVLRSRGQSIRAIARQLGIGKTTVERVLKGER
ncbi:MAG: recombinase family protein [Bdellovibrionaceae bacterium]|nr:recombinase family protein [Pseudobdellovibrionaceae bacterium]